MEACKLHFNTKYIRLPDLLINLEMSRNEGIYKKVMAKYVNPILIIIDEWFLIKPNEKEQNDIFELLHRRRINYLRYFALSTRTMTGMSSWADKQIHCPMQF